MNDRRYHAHVLGFVDFFPDRDRAGPDAMQALETDLLSKGVLLRCCPARSAGNAGKNGLTEIAGTDQQN